MAKLNEPEFVTIGQVAALGQNPIDITNTDQVEQAKAAICQAEAMVAAWIGAEDLVEHEVIAKTRLRRIKNNIEVSDGPISSVTSLLVGADAVDVADLLVIKGWVVMRNDDLLFAQNTLITLTYLAGYRIDSAGGSTMPKSVHQAMVRLAVNTFSNPISDLTEERIGDYQYVRGRQGDEPLAMPLDVQDLLLNYRKPRM